MKIPFEGFFHFMNEWVCSDGFNKATDGSWNRMLEEWIASQVLQKEVLSSEEGLITQKASSIIVSRKGSD